MAEQATPDEFLTRGPDRYPGAAAFAYPEWLPFRARLYAELAPRSLRDRLLAEAILAIAARAFADGKDVGFRVSAATVEADTLDWLGHVRARHQGRDALAALSALEALLRGTDDAASGESPQGMP